MTQHAPLLPLLIPFAAALLQMLMPLARQRQVAALSAALSIASTLWLLVLCDAGPLRVYALGDWQPPFGIVLVADRLAALMVFCCALLAAACVAYASAGADAHGRNFHPLFQLQLLGINGAFLTGDLFNLFVFFEIMLLASYALLTMTGPEDAAGGAVVPEEATICCYAQSDKLWTEDPQGTRWETFRTVGEATTYYAGDAPCATDGAACSPNVQSMQPRPEQVSSCCAPQSGCC